GHGGVVEVDPWIVELARMQRRESLAPGRHDRVELDLLRAQVRQPSLAVAELGGLRLTIGLDGGATLSSPANPSGSCHDWRTVPDRVYFGPAGARSPANRSPVSSPHRPW